MEEDVALHLKKLESSLPENALIQEWLKLPLCFWGKRFFNFVNAFLIFCYYLPLEKGMAFHLKKLKLSSTKNDLCQVWLKLALWLWRRRF